MAGILHPVADSLSDRPEAKLPSYTYHRELKKVSTGAPRYNTCSLPTGWA